MKSNKLISSAIAMLTCFLTFGQEKTITGIVSSSKKPLSEVGIVIKGTTKGTTTDLNGKYSIVAASGSVLVFQYAGYTTQMVTVTNSNTIDVELPLATSINENDDARKEKTNSTDDDPTLLREVIVEGPMGIKRPSNSTTYAKKIIGNKELNQASNPNVLSSLNGKVSGLQVNSTSNGVNGDKRIVLRGVRSITGNNQALIVIDNVISDANTLDELPPNLVDSINVIKGAQGAALYGAQGVNGVIIVNTKKGYNKKSEMEEEEEDNTNDQNATPDEDSEETPVDATPKKDK